MNYFKPNIGIQIKIKGINNIEISYKIDKKKIYLFEKLFTINKKYDIINAQLTKNILVFILLFTAR